MKSEKELQLTIEGTSNQNDWISKNKQIHIQIEIWKGL